MVGTILITEFQATEFLHRHNTILPIEVLLEQHDESPLILALHQGLDRFVADQAILHQVDLYLGLFTSHAGWLIDRHLDHIEGLTANHASQNQTIEIVVVRFRVLGL